MRSTSSSKKKCKPDPSPTPAVEPKALTKTPEAHLQVIAWMVEGHPDREIAEAIAAKFPGQNADAIIERAVDHFAAAATCQRDIIIGFAMEVYRDLYRKLVGIGDYQGAMKAIAALVKLAEKLPEPEAE